MDYVEDFFSHSSEGQPKGNFHHVIPLHKTPNVDWDEIHKIIPELSKGWFELASLNSKDRIEFIRDYWIDTLPYRQGMSEFITNFFEHVVDVGIYITQKVYDDKYEACMVYDLGDNGFYKGRLPASEQELLDLEKQFPDFILPRDFLAFLRIHNGFSKATDCTGITPGHKIYSRYLEFQKILGEQEILRTSTNKIVDPMTLIPFYESFGMPFYQCFWAEWYPDEEMGNVYYSSQTKTILFIENEQPSDENMAFPTFIDWLKFYLEGIS